MKRGATVCTDIITWILLLGLLIAFALAFGLIVPVLLVQWCYRRWHNLKERTVPLAEWQTTRLPEPELINFGAFYAELAQHGNFTRKQAERMYTLAMYLTVKGEIMQQAGELLDEYDAEIEAELIIEELMEKGA